MARRAAPGQRCGEKERYPLLHVILATGVLLLLASAPVTWAAPLQNTLRQTVPTRTPTSSAFTATPTPPPSATPTPTLVPGNEQVILRQGHESYSGAEDTYLSFAEQNTNFGTKEWLTVRGDGQRVALLRFELPNIPNDASIIEASLQLYAGNWAAPGALTASVHRVLRAWAAHEATWFRATTDDLWTVPGCNGTGTDRGLLAEASTTLDGLGYVYSFNVTEMVRSWITDQSQNYGWIVRGVTDESQEYELASAEHSIVSQRPALVITYAEETTPTPTLGGPTSTPTLTPTPIVMEFQHGGAPYPGFEGVVDTYIDSWNPQQNRAPEGRLGIRSDDVRAALIRFDLSAIPQDVHVISAILEVYVTYRSNTAHLTTSVYQVLRPWLMDEATWNQARSGVLWGQPGCNWTESPDPDRMELAEDSQFLGSKGISDWRYQFDVTAMTRHWVNFPAENYGLTLKGGTGSSVEYRLASSRGFVPQSQRPKLIVRFDSSEPAPTFTPTPTATPVVTSTAMPTLIPTSTPTTSPSAGGISGVVWHDLDGDGKIDGSEPLFQGVQVALRNDWKELLDWRTTDDQGRYAFEGLVPGHWYRVREVNPPGYVSTTSDEVRVWVSPGITLPVDFGDRRGVFLPLILKQPQ